MDRNLIQQKKDRGQSRHDDQQEKLVQKSLRPKQSVGTTANSKTAGDTSLGAPKKRSHQDRRKGGGDEGTQARKNRKREKRTQRVKREFTPNKTKIDFHRKDLNVMKQRTICGN